MPTKVGIHDSFSRVAKRHGWRPGTRHVSMPMTDNADLHPATPEEIAEALSFALRFKGRKPFLQANSLMAQITAVHLVEHLQRCGFRLMKTSDAVAPSTSPHTRSGEGDRS